MKTEVRSRQKVLRRNQTPAEAHLWGYLRNRKFHGVKFLRQHAIVFSYGGPVHYFIADFCCHEFKLIIEIDGGIHEMQKEYDEMRECTLKEMGFSILRFSNEEVLNETDIVLQKILDCINESGGLMNTPKTNPFS